MSAFLVAAVALPLATYTTALALFGLAHVGSELRYVDYRFGGRLYGRLAAWILAPLGLAVCLRVTATFGLVSTDVGVALELVLAAVMAAAAVACMRQRRFAGAAIAIALAAGAVLAPFQTLLCLAILHNLTSLAFHADALEGRTRRRTLAFLSVPFLILPLLIASGLPYAALSYAGLVEPEASLFDSGSLAVNFGVYVPASLAETPWALHVFSASVFAQCMHYAAVILALPRLIDDGKTKSRTIAPWPEQRWFIVWLAVAALALAIGFLVDFRAARQIYAIAALVHSWIEIPLLVLALDRQRMAKQD